MSLAPDLLLQAHVRVSTLLQHHQGDRRDRGASLVEYALLVALIALVCIAAVTTFGSKTGSSFTSTAGAL
jgi:pilus assembly protein Flp/PilA